MTRDLGPSQLAHALLRSANDACDAGGLVTVFVEEHVRPCVTPRFPVMQLSELWGHAGPAVATSLSSLAWLLGSGQVGPRALYAWDLEWARGTGRYADLAAMYRHPGVALVARSAEHAAVLSWSWNRPVAGVCDDFDIPELWRIIDGKEE